MSNLEIRELATSTEQLLARQLFFEVLVQEGKWDIPQPDPAGLRIESLHDGSHALADDYDSIAVFFGAFQDGELVGAHRLTPALNGLHQVQRYNVHSLPAFLCRDNAIELTRLAIRPQARHSPAMLLLFHKEFEWVVSNHTEYAFTTAHFPEPGEMFVRLGMQLSPLAPFRFLEHDPDPVQLLHVHRDEVATTKLWKMTTRLLAGSARAVAPGPIDRPLATTA
jgi:hypothetical protein